MQHGFYSKKQILACMLLVLSSASAFGESKIDPLDLSASKLAAVCSKFLTESKSREVVPDFSAGLCIGIIVGVEDNAAFDQKICIPITTTTYDRISAVSSYIATQTGRAKEAYASLAFDALIANWPCKTKN